LLNLLVKGAGEETEQQGLSESELIGNAFIFMVAGHETTAGALNYALTHLGT
jgi:cytochrome P450